MQRVFALFVLGFLSLTFLPPCEYQAANKEGDLLLPVVKPFGGFMLFPGLHVGGKVGKPLILQGTRKIQRCLDLRLAETLLLLMIF